jgi:hypothetical protein
MYPDEGPPLDMNLMPVSTSMIFSTVLSVHVLGLMTVGIVSTKTPIHDIISRPISTVHSNCLGAERVALHLETDGYLVLSALGRLDGKGIKKSVTAGPDMAFYRSVVIPIVLTLEELPYLVLVCDSEIFVHDLTYHANVFSNAMNDIALVLAYYPDVVADIPVFIGDFNGLYH